MTNAPNPAKKHLSLFFIGIALFALIIVISMIMQSRATIEDVESFLGERSVEVVSEHEQNIDLFASQVNTRDHIRGAEDPKVIWIEYGDFECPYCGQMHIVLEEALAKYPNDLALVYRHFPLEIHPYAFEKAVVSECVANTAGENAFWRFHDLLFENAGANGAGVDLNDLPVLADSVGVSEEQLNTCMDSGEFDYRVESDVSTGIAVGITGTPGSIVLGIDGSASFIPGVVSPEQIDAIMGYFMGIDL